jgi:hypothetical protein
MQLNRQQRTSGWSAVGAGAEESRARSTPIYEHGREAVVKPSIAASRIPGRASSFQFMIVGGSAKSFRMPRALLTPFVAALPYNLLWRFSHTGPGPALPPPARGPYSVATSNFCSTVDFEILGQTVDQ